MVRGHTAVGRRARRAIEVVGTAPRGPALVLVPGILWWMVNLTFYTLGLIHSPEGGYRAWLYGLSSFPRWFQTVVARISPICWIAVLLVMGANVTLHGRRAWIAMLTVLLAITVSTIGLVEVGSFAFRHAHG